MSLSIRNLRRIKKLEKDKTSSHIYEVRKVIALEKIADMLSQRRD